ncbi:hypothetical protein CAPN002_23370 [Capnocytophaga stomatis]|uniref:hypothetical protein n=1 Tax=Capnocytophaga stomatis TaxID=1848904 RepID=UPI00194DE888|nr:hypothetical protein [Capnocytophaga stomatis]GIJ95119.1 hypothetical protein CAPN002_23370 [Capnocytophaga stomatis]
MKFKILKKETVYHTDDNMEVYAVETRTKLFGFVIKRRYAVRMGNNFITITSTRNVNTILELGV